MGLMAVRAVTAEIECVAGEMRAVELALSNKFTFCYYNYTSTQHVNAAGYTPDAPPP